MDDPKIRVELPIPTRNIFPRGSGLLSTSDIGKVSARIPQPEKDLIYQEAKRLNMTVSMFVRWATVFTAAYLRANRKSGEDHGEETV